MRIRSGPGAPFKIKYEALFEECWFRKIEKTSPFASEILDNIEWQLSRSPGNVGEACEAFTDRVFRFTVTPRTRRLVSIRVLFEIRDDVVHLWFASIVE